MCCAVQFFVSTSHFINITSSIQANWMRRGYACDAFDWYISNLYTYMYNWLCIWYVEKNIFLFLTGLTNYSFLFSGCSLQFSCGFTQYDDNVETIVNVNNGAMKTPIKTMLRITLKCILHLFIPTKHFICTYICICDIMNVISCCFLKFIKDWGNIFTSLTCGKWRLIHKTAFVFLFVIFMQILRAPYIKF